MTDTTDGLPLRERRWAVLTIALAITMAVLDGAIANIALPTIARDFNASAAAAIWVVNAYQLALTVTLLPLAALGDKFGYARIYRTGLIVFTLASVACCLADSLSTLMVARVLQGLGASGIMSVNSALTRFAYPYRLLGRGLGINAMIVATAAALGPSVAAGILAVGPWQWLFAINLPLGIIALLASRTLPLSPLNDRSFDWLSAVLNALTFGLLVIGIASLGHGEPLALVLGELAGALVFAVLLVARSLSDPLPLLPLDLLRLPNFSLSVATSICSFTAQGLAFVSLPFYLQSELGRSETQTGLLMTPWPLAIGAIAVIAGRLADKYSVRLLGGIGLAIYATGLGLVALVEPGSSQLDIVWRMAICGIGFGLFQAPNNRAIINAAPLSRSGGASGMLSTARLLGQSLGAAIAALAFGLLAHWGMAGALLIAAGFAILGLCFSSLRANRA